MKLLRAWAGIVSALKSRRKRPKMVDSYTITWSSGNTFQSSGVVFTSGSPTFSSVVTRDDKDLFIERIFERIDDPALGDAAFREWLRENASHVTYQGDSGLQVYARPVIPQRSLLDDFLDSPF